MTETEREAPAVRTDGRLVLKFGTPSSTIHNDTDEVKKPFVILRANLSRLSPMRRAVADDLIKAGAWTMVESLPPETVTGAV